MGLFSSNFKADSVVFVLQTGERDNPLSNCYAKILAVKKDAKNRKVYTCQKLYPVLVNNTFMGWFGGVSANAAQKFECFYEELHKEKPKGIEWKLD